MGKWRQFASVSAGLRLVLRPLAWRDGLPLIPLAALLASLPRLRGVSCGDDLDFHLVNWLEVQRSWSQGVLYPHWAQSPNWGAGEPRFVFYPPLTWIAGALLGYLFPWSWVPAILIFLSLAAAGLATRALARQFLPAPNATLAGILAAIAPYALFTAYQRSALSELAAAVWIPLLLLFALKPQAAGKRALPSDASHAGLPSQKNESFDDQPLQSLSQLTANLDEAERRYNRLGQPDYISGDRIKELLQAWQDKANRLELEEREHANASKIAYELFYRKAARLPKNSAVNLVTGPVAAGKTSAIGDGADLTYEVNLSDKDKAFEHLDKLLDLGLKPTIHYIYTTPELSVERRALRAQKDGRAVRIDRSTSQHLHLPQTMLAVSGHYGDSVPINVLDTSEYPVRRLPVLELEKLAYTGTEENLLERQQRHLDTLRDTGAISGQLHRQLSRRASEIRGQVGAVRPGPAQQNRRAKSRREGSPHSHPATATPLIPTPHSLFPAPHSLFPAPCSLFPTPYSLIPLSAFLAAAWLTNAPAGVMASYLLAFAAVAAAAIQRRWEPILRAALAAPLGLGLAAFYLIPAAWEQRWIAVQQALDVGLRVQDSWLFARHADPLMELHDHVLQIASALVAVTAALALSGFLFCLARRRLPRESRQFWLPLAALIPLIFLLQLPISASLWNALPKLQFLQFPWRWLTVLAVPYSIFLAAATPLSTSRARAASSAFWFLTAFGIAAAASLVFFQFCDADSEIPSQLSAFQVGSGVSGTDEYAAIGSDNSTIASNLPDACLLADPSQPLGETDSGASPVWYPEQGSCDDTYTAQLRQTERKRLQIDTDHGGFLVLRLSRYPAWQIDVNGRPAPSQGSRGDGLIALPVAEGPSTIDIHWTATPDVRWGRRVSLLSLLLLLALWCAERRRNPRRLSS